MDYKTILYKDVSNEQIVTIHNLLKSISGLHPKNHEKYGISMTYDSWAEHYIVELPDTKIQIQLLSTGICHLRYGTLHGEIYLEQSTKSLQFYKYYNPVINIVKSYGVCKNKLVHVKTLKENDIINGIKIFEVSKEFVYYIKPESDGVTYNINNVKRWSYTSNNDRFDALDWGIIIAEPSSILNVIELNNTLNDLI